MRKQSIGIELAEEIETMKQQMPLIIQQVVLQAELKHKYFRALVTNGFTEEQALEIIKSEGN
ncbi:hypothetical protein WMZ97_13075 [Lentibacillus sp. N15]|uniref:hypothetical protein n=1 Tax=Lentibacillus songyuanensis TaxID=3136161 RepID=UPI0031BB6C87